MAKFGSFKYSEEKYGVGVTTGNLLWSFVVKWDNVEWSPNEAYGRMTNLYVSRGREHLLAGGGQGLQSFRPGKAVATLDNSDGRFDPFNVDSPLYPNVSPGKFVRVAVRDDSTDTDYGLIRGIIDDIQPVKQGDREQVRIVVVDGLEWLRDRIINLGQQTDIAKNTVFDLIYAEADWPTTEWPVSRTADPTIQDFWWGWAQTAYEALEEFDQAEWAAMFHDRDGNLTWRPRNYTYNRTISISEGEILRDIGRPQPWEVVRNIVRVLSSPKILDDVDATLWSLQSKPPLLDKETFFIEPVFKYSEWSPVCGDDVSFDFTVNTQADGLGDDITINCDLVYDEQIGEGARLWLTNNSGQSGYIVAFTATGDAIYPPSADIREEQDATSKAAYGPRSLTVGSRWVEDTKYARQLSYWLLHELKNPALNPIIQMEDQLVNQFYPDLYDRVALTIDTLTIDANYRVGHIEHRWLNENGQSVRTTLHLEPYLVAPKPSYGCLLTRSANYVLGTGSWETMEFNIDKYDTDAFHHPGVSGIVIPTGLGGYYRIFANVFWEGNAVGVRKIRLGEDGTYAENISAPKGGLSFTQRLEVTRYMAAGETVKLYVYQSSGGDLDVIQTFYFTPLFGVEFLGA